MAQLVTAPINEMYKQLNLALTKIDTELSGFIKNGLVKSTCLADIQFNTGLSLCIRKSERVLSNKSYKSLDINSLLVSADFKRLGAAVSAIKMMHQLNPYELTYLYKVLDKNMCFHLQKIGWFNDGHSNYFSYTNPNEANTCV